MRFTVKGEPFIRLGDSVRTLNDGSVQFPEVIDDLVCIPHLYLKEIDDICGINLVSPPSSQISSRLSLMISTGFLSRSAASVTNAVKRPFGLPLFGKVPCDEGDLLLSFLISSMTGDMLNDSSTSSPDFVPVPHFSPFRVHFRSHGFLPGIETFAASLLRCMSN